MENNENFVEQTENVEQTTEETVVEPAKVFTQDDLNAAVGKAKARERAKVEKQYQRKYGDFIDLVKAGTGAESEEVAFDRLQKFYQSKGVKPKAKPEYNDRDITILGQAEANDIIQAGFDDVVDEVDRLTEVGVANMTAKEKVIFKSLAEYRQSEERRRELSSIGVTADVYNSEDFKEFSKMFNPNTPVKKIYETYSKTLPKKEFKTAGSMKNIEPEKSKDYYSYEEAMKFTKKDFDNDPELYRKVQESMLRWGKK